MDLETHSINLDARREEEEVVYHRLAKRLIDVMGQQLEKKFGIERLKELGATKLVGTTQPKEAEKWIRTLKKCSKVMQCPKERKVNLDVFLLQKRLKIGGLQRKIGGEE